MAIESGAEIVVLHLQEVGPSALLRPPKRRLSPLGQLSKPGSMTLLHLAEFAGFSESLLAILADRLQ